MCAPYDLRQEVARLRRQLELTTICVTHDAADVAALADRTIMMRGGRIDPVTLRSHSAQ